jgi:hypothetical protein
LEYIFYGINKCLLNAAPEDIELGAHGKENMAKELENYIKAI